MLNPSHLKMMASITGVPIQELSEDKIFEINEAPQAQRRTAKFKKAVYIVGDLVFKGPYKNDDPLLINNLMYTYAMQLLEVSFKLPEWQKCSFRWDYLGINNNNRYYLVGPNVGKQQNIPFELVSTKIETNVKVVPRGGSVKRVSEVEGTDRLTDKIKSAALQHLYLRFLMDVGDSGTHNILVREDYNSTGRLIAGIDLEERRAIKEKERRLDYLFNKIPSKKQISLYEADICKIKLLSYSQLDQYTLDRLRAIGIDLERLKGNMELWERLN